MVDFGFFWWAWVQDVLPKRDVQSSSSILYLLSALPSANMVYPLLSFFSYSLAKSLYLFSLPYRTLASPSPIVAIDPSRISYVVSIPHLLHLSLSARLTPHSLTPYHYHLSLYLSLSFQWTTMICQDILYSDSRVDCWSLSWSLLVQPWSQDSLHGDLFCWNNYLWCCIYRFWYVTATFLPPPLSLSSPSSFLLFPFSSLFIFLCCSL